MKKSLFKQFFFVYILLSLFLLSTVGIYFLQYLHTEQFNASQERTTLVWKLLSKDIFDDIYSLNNPTLNNRLLVMSQYLNATIYIYDSKNRVIVRYIRGYLDESEYEQSDLEKLILLEMQTSLKTEEGKHFTIQDKFISSYLIYSARDVMGYFVVIQDKDTLLRSWDNMLSDLILLVLLVFTIALIVYILYIKKLLDPVRHLTKVASLINVKNMDIPIIESSKNEIGELANQFRQMSKSLKSSFAELTSQKEMLLSIINTVNQAIWIVDESGKIIMANPHFQSMLPTIDYLKDSLYNVMRSPDILKIYKDTIEQKTHTTREIEFHGKICLCTSSWVTSNKNVIFTLLDLSEIKSVEKMKKDIISNVSHELKTPLTTIKGFIETLMEDALPEAKNYLEIVQRNTDRLIMIVNDILTLSRLESSTAIDTHTISLHNFFKKIEMLCSELYKDRKLTINCILPPDLPLLNGDEYLLEQLFINLIDNAVKYGNDGNITISVSFEQSHFTITVSDNGIGIPPEHLKRIFERFYVVDKSRSKRMGGTGLGLSIVKHIVNLHGGDITVESVENEGSNFVVMLPLHHH